MIQYKIFHLGYGGTLYNSEEVIFEMSELNFDTDKEAFDFLRLREAMGELRKDLTFIVLPVYKAK